MLQKLKYEMVILLDEGLNDSELKTWAFQSANELQKLGGSEIFVVSKGKRNLSYPIKRQDKSNFIEFNFCISPKELKKFNSTVALDTNVVRSLILKK
jgi:ribosomal protein S6|tara:strand:- start:913 stop:1203 length:291 start_codon:yes stop_codon:yes gene_type:complete